MTGIRPPPRRGRRPCGLLLPASQAIGCDHRVGKGVRRVFAHAPREASAIGQYLATLGLSAFDWRRQFGPALDQTIFGLERHDPLVMSGARRGPWSIPCSCFGMSRVSVSFRRAAAVEGRPRAALESQPANRGGLSWERRITKPARNGRRPCGGFGSFQPLVDAWSTMGPGWSTKGNPTALVPQTC
jgi:hypothetical protein